MYSNTKPEASSQEEECPFQPGDIVDYTRWLANPRNGGQVFRLVLILRPGRMISGSWWWQQHSFLDLGSQNALWMPSFYCAAKNDPDIKYYSLVVRKPLDDLGIGATI